MPFSTVKAVYMKNTMLCVNYCRLWPQCKDVMYHCHLVHDVFKLLFSTAFNLVLVCVIIKQLD